ncbi:MAG: helix-turn-helix transcriptional regulator [Deltaproteobacteria bacterium]|nr:helix-turn-helix transcriptional regulator [Deltaproteobacteria bacterium]MBW2072717.1 helix-turn-helix transcriptional regulator [Deltaproteobacteria bacterium]
MHIGEKLRRLRKANNLTQEELANRAYLTKGFISQLERDLTSPSITTLKGILDVLGEELADFFRDIKHERIVFEKKSRVLSSASTEKMKIEVLVPSAQSRLMDPVLLELAPGVSTETHTPHEGEEFGFLLQGRVTVWVDKVPYRIKKGDCFYFSSNSDHRLQNTGKNAAKILWIVSPPVFY